MKKFYKTKENYIYNSKMPTSTIPLWDFWGHGEDRVNINVVIRAEFDYKIRMLFANLLK